MKPHEIPNLRDPQNLTDLYQQSQMDIIVQDDGLTILPELAKASEKGIKLETQEGTLEDKNGTQKVDLLKITVPEQMIASHVVPETVAEGSKNRISLKFSQEVVMPIEEMNERVIKMAKDYLNPQDDELPSIEEINARIESLAAEIKENAAEEEYDIIGKRQALKELRFQLEQKTSKTLNQAVDLRQAYCELNDIDPNQVDESKFGIWIKRMAGQDVEDEFQTERLHSQEKEKGEITIEEQVDAELESVLRELIFDMYKTANSEETSKSIYALTGIRIPKTAIQNITQERNLDIPESLLRYSLLPNSIEELRSQTASINFEGSTREEVQASIIQSNKAGVFNTIATSRYGPLLKILTLNTSQETNPHLQDLQYLLFVKLMSQSSLASDQQTSTKMYEKYIADIKNKGEKGHTMPDKIQMESIKAEREKKLEKEEVKKDMITTLLGNQTAQNSLQSLSVISYDLNLRPDQNRVITFLTSNFMELINGSSTLDMSEIDILRNKSKITSRDYVYRQIKTAFHNMTITTGNHKAPLYELSAIPANMPVIIRAMEYAVHQSEAGSGKPLSAKARAMLESLANLKASEESQE